MNQLLPAGIRRAALYTGTLGLVLAACTACVGSSTPTSGGSNTASAPGGGSGTAASSPAAASSTPAASGGGTGTTASSPAGGGSTGAAGAGAPQACLTQNLSATTADTGAAAGSDYVNIVFKNIGGEPCTMYGYPGVSFGAGAPVTQVGQPAGRNPQVNPLIVTLIPNAHAFAVLQIADAGNYPPASCSPKPTTDLRIYPPDNKTLLYVPYTSTACGGNEVTLRIEAVQPGSGS